MTAEEIQRALDAAYVVLGTIGGLFGTKLVKGKVAPPEPEPAPALTMADIEAQFSTHGELNGAMARMAEEIKALKNRVDREEGRIDRMYERKPLE